MTSGRVYSVREQWFGDRRNHTGSRPTWRGSATYEFGYVYASQTCCRYNAGVIGALSLGLRILQVTLLVFTRDSGKTERLDLRQPRHAQYQSSHEEFGRLPTSVRARNHCNHPSEQLVAWYN